MDISILRKMKWQWFLLILNLADCTADITITGPDKVIGNLGDDIYLSCNFAADTKFSSAVLRWTCDLETIYGYSVGLYDGPSQRDGWSDEDTARYKRDNYSLIIENFKEIDVCVTDICCGVEILDEQSQLQIEKRCFPLNWTDIKQDALKCVDENGQQLDNNTAVVTEGTFQANCSYTDIYPPSDIQLYVDGSKTSSFASRKDAKEEGNRYSLTLPIDIDVQKSSTLKIQYDGTYVVRDIIIPMQYADDEAGAVYGGMTSMVKCEPIILLLAFLVSL